MTAAEYQQEALKTWTGDLPGTEAGREYLRLGLLSEMGEVWGVLKRIIRDGWPMELWRPKLVAELGDVAWYLAVDCYEDGLPFATSSMRVGFWDRSVLDRADDASITWEEVFAANIAKLRDRQARGVIQGEGDER